MRRLLTFSFGFSLIPACVLGQQNSFQWGWQAWNSTTLAQCQSLQLFLDPTVGTVKPNPPYYFIAYEIGGVSTWSAVGSNTNNMFWTNTHATGSRLVLNMVDANGNSGGIDPNTYTVSGGNSSCTTSSKPSSSLSVGTNASTTLDTCSAIQLQISGGTPPYTVTIAEQNAVSMINATLPQADDMYTWVNTLSPGGSVVLAVSDSAGSYGVTTPLITLTGSTNTHCSTSSFSSSSGGSTSHHSDIGIIVGCAVAGVVILGLIGWFFLFRKRRANRHKTTGWAIDAYPGRSKSTSPTHPSHPMLSDVEVTPFDVQQSAGSSYTDMHRESQALHRGPGSYMDNTGSTAVSAHGHQADSSGYVYPPPSTRSPPSTYYKGHAEPSEFPSSSSGSTLITHNPDSHPSNASSLGDRKLSPGQGQAGTASRPVYQHQDAGAVEEETEPPVEEIPPAYPGVQPGK